MKKECICDIIKLELEVVDMGFYFSISALIIILLFTYNFLSKERVNNIETKIYKYLLFLTIFGLSMDITTCILFKVGVDINSFW